MSYTESSNRRYIHTIVIDLDNLSGQVIEVDNSFGRLITVNKSPGQLIDLDKLFEVDNTSGRLIATNALHYRISTSIICPDKLSRSITIVNTLAVLGFRSKVLLYSITDNSLQRLQFIQNAAAHLLTGTR